MNWYFLYTRIFYFYTISERLVHPVIELYQWLCGKKHDINLLAIPKDAFTKESIKQFSEQLALNKTIFDQAQRLEEATAATDLTAPDSIWFNTDEDYQQMNRLLKTFLYDYDEEYKSPLNLYHNILRYLLHYPYSVANRALVFNEFFKRWFHLAPEDAVKFYRCESVPGFFNQHEVLLQDSAKIIFQYSADQLKINTQGIIESSPILTHASFMALYSHWTNVSKLLKKFDTEESWDGIRDYFDSIFPASRYSFYVYLMRAYLGYHQARFNLVDALNIITKVIDEPDKKAGIAIELEMDESDDYMWDDSDEETIVADALVIPLVSQDARFERLLIEILAGLDNEAVRAQLIELLESPPINCQDWITKTYGKETVFSLAARYGNVKLIRFLLMQSDERKPSCEAITKAKKHVTCSVTTLEKSEVIQELIAISDDNGRLHESALADILSWAVSAGSMPIVQYIVDTLTKNRTNRDTMRDALLLAVHTAQLPMLRYLAEKMNYEDDVMSSALAKAAACGRSDLMVEIIKLSDKTTLNCSLAFVKAAEHGYRDIVEFFLRQEPKPDAESMGEALIAASQTQPKYDHIDMIRFFLNFTGENKPRAEAVNEAFRRILRVNCWRQSTIDLIYDVLNLSGDNKPNTESVGMAIERASGYEKKWDIVHAILNLAQENKSTKPTVASVSKVLSNAGYRNQWDVVLRILNLYGVSNLEDEPLQSVSRSAIKNDRWDIVLEILKLPNPSGELIRSALYSALKMGRLEVFHNVIAAIPRQDRLRALVDEQILYFVLANKLDSINSTSLKKEYSKIILASLSREERVSLIMAYHGFSSKNIIQIMIDSPESLKIIFDLMSVEERMEVLARQNLRRRHASIKKAESQHPESVKLLLDYLLGHDPRLLAAYHHVVSEMVSSPSKMVFWKRMMRNFTSDYDCTYEQYTGDSSRFKHGFSIPGHQLTLQEFGVIVSAISQQSRPLLISASIEQDTPRAAEIPSISPREIDSPQTHSRDADRKIPSFFVSQSASTTYREISSVKSKAIGKLCEYRFKRQFENDYTSIVGRLLSVFGTFNKQEKCDAAKYYIEVLKGERDISSLTTRTQNALQQGRLGEVMKEVKNLLSP